MVKKNRFCEKYVVENCQNGEAKASLHIKNNLEKIKEVFHCGGNGLKHQRFIRCFMCVIS